VTPGRTRTATLTLAKASGKIFAPCVETGGHPPGRCGTLIHRVRGAVREVGGGGEGIRQRNGRPCLAAASDIRSMVDGYQRVS